MQPDRVEIYEINEDDRYTFAYEGGEMVWAMYGSVNMKLGISKPIPAVFATHFDAEINHNAEYFKGYYADLRAQLISYGLEPEIRNLE